MITVVSIRRGKYNDYHIDLSTQETLRVSEDVLVKYRLLKGSELTEATLKEIQKNATVDFGLQLTLNYISYQLRSEKEVRNYLKEKEIPWQDQAKIIERLKELGVVDDQLYGESFVRTQIRLSDKGPIRVRQQLKEKGISDLIIEAVLELFTFEDQFDLAYRVAEKAAYRFRTKSHQETLNKLRQTLMQKGFSSEIITSVLDELNLEKDEEEEVAALFNEGEKIWRRHQSKPFKERKNKTKQSLYQKGFDLDIIAKFIAEKELENDAE